MDGEESSFKNQQGEHNLTKEILIWERVEGPALFFEEKTKE